MVKQSESRKPSPVAYSAWLTRTIIEVILGIRPSNQLIPMMEPGAYREVDRLKEDYFKGLPPSRVSITNVFGNRSNNSMFYIVVSVMFKYGDNIRSETFRYAFHTRMGKWVVKEFSVVGALYERQFETGKEVHSGYYVDEEAYLRME